MTQLKKCLLLLSFFVINNLHSQTLNADEKKILETIRTGLPRQLQLLQHLVDINSGTLNVNGVRTVGDSLRVLFDKIGFTTEWISMPDSMKRAGHLVASIKGKKGKNYCSSGILIPYLNPICRQILTAR